MGSVIFRSFRYSSFDIRCYFPKDAGTFCSMVCFVWYCSDLSFSGANVMPTSRNNREAIESRLAAAEEAVENMAKIILKECRSHFVICILLLFNG